MKDLPRNVEYHRVGSSITNALLYQLSYPGALQIMRLAMLRSAIESKCSGFCAFV